MKKVPKQIKRGIYLLEMKAESNIRIEHPKFNDNVLPEGYYYYSGSAQKNLDHRIIRHLKKEKETHWHVDYLTTRKEIIIENIYQIPNLSKKSECILIAKLLRNTGLESIINNFGSSDCKKCNSHLLYSKNKIDQSHLFSLYQSTVLFIPSSRPID